MTTAILTTKLYVPLPRPNWVSRPHLIERLNTGVRQGQRLVLVSAPAGFGKTTLLSEWLHQAAEERQNGTAAGKNSRPSSRPSPLRLAWLSLDEDDNDPIRFLAYLVAALRQIAPHIGDGILSAIQSPQARPLDSTLTSLINELVAIPSGFALVLDDYHLIEAQPIHQALTFLLEHLPPQMHLIIASRVDPPLPLALLRTRNQLVELRATDLRFTPEEVVTFLKRTMDLELSPQEVEALEARTEGWIAGLQLAALSMQGLAAGQVADFVAAFSGSHRHVIDYLADEILAQQPPEIHDFLCQTSILDRLTAPLCDAVLNGGTALPGEPGNTDNNPSSHRPANSLASSQEILEYLDRANLFLVPLDHRREWYRYHRLFADFLRGHLQADMPGRVPELHRRASRWYEQEGLLPAAVSHALAAKEFTRAAGLIERAIEPAMMRGELATVLGWLNALPDPVLGGHPLLCVYHALVLLYSGHPLEDIKSRLQAALYADPAGDFAGEIAVLKAFTVILEGKPHQAAEFSRAALELLPAMGLFFRSLVLVYLGVAELYMGDISVAARLFEEAAISGQQAGNLLIAVAAWYRLATLAMVQGQYYKARTLFEQALELALEDQERPRPVGGISMIGLGWLLYEWNELESATRHLVEGIELAEKMSKIMGIPGYIGLALVRQAQGDVAGADLAIQTARQLAAKFQAMELDDIFVATYQVFVWIAQGNLAAAQGWVEERGLEQEASLREFEQKASNNSLSYLRAMEYVILARLRLAQKRPGGALSLLDLLLPRTKKAGWVWLEIEILILQALAYHQADDPQALAALERALSLAEPGGFVRLFINEGPPMAELLRQLAARGAASDYAGRLLAARNADRPRMRGTVDKSSSLSPSPLPPSWAGPPGEDVPRLTEPLSEREIEVLKLIADGLSNQEIASVLIVATSTIKTHIQNIFRKLDVSSRTQAVARARELNLV